MDPLTDILLDVDDISFSYGYWRVIEACSFKATAGDLVHVTGANGAGKTTLMALIAGLLRPMRGRIRLMGSEGKDIVPRARGLELLQAEHNGLFLKLDAWENLAFWGRLKDRDVAPGRLAELLGEWGFTRSGLYEGFAVEKFSTGMKRRLSLARVVLSGARLWLLDEPCNGLDAKGRASFINALDAHLKRGGIALVASHDNTIFGELAVRQLVL